MKGESTRQKIINKSLPLFAKKGYTGVTMSDICNTTSLSRGGLYRYFSSVKDVFIAILETDISGHFHTVKNAIQNRISAVVILNRYFDLQKAEIISENHGLFFAVHEFAFIERDQRDYFIKRSEQTIALISDILRYGQETNVFGAFDSITLATHIVYFFDSLKTSASILSMSEDMIDQQIKLIKEMIS